MGSVGSGSTILWEPGLEGWKGEGEGEKSRKRWIRGSVERVVSSYIISWNGAKAARGVGRSCETHVLEKQLESR